MKSSLSSLHFHFICKLDNLNGWLAIVIKPRADNTDIYNNIHRYNGFSFHDLALP